MQISTTADRAFKKVYIDLIGKIYPNTDAGNCYIFVCVCELSKYTIAVGIPDATTDTIMNCFIENVLLRFGFIFEILVSDNAQYFRSESFRTLNRLLRQKHIFTSAYKPNSNLAERVNRSLLDALRATIQNDKNNWCKYLNTVTYFLNNSVSPLTGYAPNEIVFGYISTPPTNVLTSRKTYNYDDYLMEFTTKLKQYAEIAKENILKRKEYNKDYYDEKHKTKDLDVRVGDSVYTINQRKKHKLDYKWTGPFVVYGVTSPTTILIKRKNKMVQIHKDHVKLHQE